MAMAMEQLRAECLKRNVVDEGRRDDEYVVVWSAAGEGVEPVVVEGDVDLAFIKREMDKSYSPLEPVKDAVSLRLKLSSSASLNLNNNKVSVASLLPTMKHPCSAFHGLMYYTLHCPP